MGEGTTTSAETTTTDGDVSSLTVNSEAVETTDPEGDVAVTESREPTTAEVRTDEEQVETDQETVVAETYRSPDFGADIAGWALCRSFDGSGENLGLIVLYGTRQGTGTWLERFIFGGEITDPDAVGTTLIIEFPSASIIEPGIPIETEVDLTVIESSSGSDSTIETQTGETVTTVTIENLGLTTCQTELEEIRFEVDDLVEMPNGEVIRVDVEGQTS